jgi:hypothetical protein
MSTYFKLLTTTEVLVQGGQVGVRLAWFQIIKTKKIELVKIE